MSVQSCESISQRDRQLIRLLSEKLARTVRPWDEGLALPSGGGLNDGSTDRASDSRTQIHRQSDDQAIVTVALPDGSFAYWECHCDHAPALASHAETILALDESQRQRDQLQNETDALATQVVDNFEELSLLRSLASSLELPASRAVEVPGLILNHLQPLAQCIGAESIAAVLLDSSETVMESPIWSNESVTDDDTLFQLIRQHRDEAAIQPVVRNHQNDFEHTFSASGVREFILVQCRSEGRKHGWLIACNRLTESSEDVPWAQVGFTTVQASLLETATNQLAALLHNIGLLQQKEALFTEVVRALVNAVEARDTYTCGHSERVALFGRELAEIVGMSTEDCDRIYLTGLLHDVGKIAVPDLVLGKPGRLDYEERQVIEGHTEAGWRILQGLDALRGVLPGVLYHHEQFDGTGYPDRLCGDQIPLDGRILAVCDSFDAMTSNRPYRQGMPTEKAVQILRDGAGTYWDPDLIALFVQHIDRFERIRKEHQPREQAARLVTPGRPSIDARA